MQAIKLKQINNIKVKPILTGGALPIEKIRGGKLFGEVYSNIFLLAKKKSGKTTIIAEILKHCASKRTKVVIFCSTVNKDDSYKEIIKMLENKGIEVEKYTSLIENGVNKLEEIIHEIQKEAEEEENKEDVPKQKIKYIRVDEDSDDEKEKKPRKEKLLAPEWIFVFDDLSDDMRNPVIEGFLKKNRHFKAKCILSSQWLTQLKPGGIQQLDYVLLWGRIPEEKVKETYAKLDLGIDYNNFYTLYQNATSEKYNFLYIDVRNEQFRKNFNKGYELSE